MNITYLDADTREVIDVIDDTEPTIGKVGTERFAARLGATVVKLVPTPYENEWKVELKIPVEARRLHMPLPGDRVYFIAKAGGHEAEVEGVYQFMRHHSYVVLDDGGGEWELGSMWEMRKRDRHLEAV